MRPTSNIPRRRWQFSLRTLLIVMLIVMLPFAWWTYGAQRQRAAVAALRRAKCVCDYESGLRMFLPDALTKAIGADYFANCVSVRVTTETTDADLELLQRLPGLRQLHCMDTNITDVGLEHLKGLTTLELVDLRGSKVTDTGVERLRGALPKCRIRYERRQIPPRNDSGVRAGESAGDIETR